MIAVLEEIVGAPLVLEELKRKPGRRRTTRALGSVLVDQIEIVLEASR